MRIPKRDRIRKISNQPFSKKTRLIEIVRQRKKNLVQRKTISILWSSEASFETIQRTQK